ILKIDRHWALSPIGARISRSINQCGFQARSRRMKGNGQWMGTRAPPGVPALVLNNGSRSTWVRLMKSARFPCFRANTRPAEPFTEYLEKVLEPAGFSSSYKH